MPTFVPFFDAKLGGPVRENLTAWLRAGEADALIWASGGGSLKPTEIWRRSRWYNTEFPVVSVILNTTDPDESGDRSHLRESHVITVEVECEGDDPDELVLEAEQRLNALDEILRKATKADILKDYDPRCAGAEWLQIGEHDYRYAGNEEKLIYRIRASFPVTVSMMEIKHVGG